MMQTETTTPIRVLLVDDHTLFRSGIKALLERQKDVEIVGEAGDGHEGVKRALSLKPDVVLLDLHMPGLLGNEAVQLIVDASPECKVVILTVSEDADDLLNCLRAGAIGYLLKNVDTDFLIDSVRRAAEGEAVMSTQMTRKLMQNVRCPIRDADAEITALHDKLTSRERETLLVLARGATNKEIARELDLAESTVKIYLQGILKKLGLTSRVQAAVYAVEHGLLKP